MEKNTSVPLLVVTILMLLYTSYYAATRPPVVTPSASTPPILGEVVAEEPVDKNFLTMKDGKTVMVKETNPSGESLSTITLTTTGFTDNAPIILEKNKLTNFFLADLDQDNHEELVLITTAQGSGSYGEITILTSASSSKLSQVPVPELTEEMTTSGGMFEGYMGHDIFTWENTTLVREFPLYVASDTQMLPTGGVRRVYYVMEMNASGTPEIILGAKPPIALNTITSLDVATGTESTPVSKATSTTP